jgi:hypothetical protein
MDLVTAYSAAYETETDEEVSARVITFFRNSLVTMRSIKHAAENNDVEYALAEIGRTRVHYANVSLERCMELRPELSVFLQWCISLRDRSAREHTQVSWKTLMEQWNAAPGFDPGINVKSLSSMGIFAINKMNTVEEIKMEESSRLSGRVHQQYSHVSDLEVGIRFRGSAAVTCHRCGYKSNEVVLEAGAELPFTRLLLARPGRPLGVAAGGSELQFGSSASLH